MEAERFELTKLPLGSNAKIVALKTAGLARNRLLDLGLVPATIIEAVYKSPAGDPVAYKIRGALIALRAEESRQIIVESI